MPSEASSHGGKFGSSMILEVCQHDFLFALPEDLGLGR